MPGFKKLEKALPMSFNEVAIKVTNLSKCYEIYNSPRDRLKQFIFPILRRFLGKAPTQYFRDFWALKDISFEIKKGETFGVIGKNGSGKSTLLQILCGTLTPTDGLIEINGRVAALLELGSGFNTEFTGRENIYMNAGILGLSKNEIDARFNDIVDFADIGDFLDQPVKTYSSGMYVRLAFSVIVHVDADILIVDEALSVGDMYFQAKCMVKMKKLMKSGVTVLFVSHDISAVKLLCNRAVYLEYGKIITAGLTDEVVDSYYGVGAKKNEPLHLSTSTEKSKSAIRIDENYLGDQQNFKEMAAFHRLQNGMVELLNVQLLDENGNILETVDFGQTVNLKMVFKASVNLPSAGVAYHIRDRNGFDVIYSDTGIERCYITDLKTNQIMALNWKFKVCLQEGNYTITVTLSIPNDLSKQKIEICDLVPIAANFQVIRGNSPPIYGVAYWNNEVKLQRLTI